MIDISLQFLDVARINVGAVLPGYTFKSNTPDSMYTMFRELSDSMNDGIPLYRHRSYRADLANKVLESNNSLFRNCIESSNTLEEYSDLELENFLSKLGYDIYPDEYDDDIELI